MPGYVSVGQTSVKVPERRVRDVLTYLSKHGKSSVLDIAKQCKLSRPMIYIVINFLSRESLVRFETTQTPRAKKNGKSTGTAKTKLYSATPRGLRRLVEEEHA